MQCTGKLSAAGTIQILMSVNLNVQSPVLVVSYECGTMFCAAETWNYPCRLYPYLFYSDPGTG